MSKTSCPKSVPGLTNMPKNTKPTMGLVRHCLQYYAQMDIGFECSHPVISCPFRILTIFLIYKCYGSISKKKTLSPPLLKCSSKSSCIHASFRAFLSSLLL